MPEWDLLLTDVRIATMRSGGEPYGVLADDGSKALCGLGIKDGRIAWLGPAATQPRCAAGETRSLGGRWLTPALIDCHTHIVFAGDRAAEFEQRLAGASYQEIAKAGGGIMSTVRATRAASKEQLLQIALPRAKALRAEGVATLEIKSGYGLELETELKMLEVAAEIGDRTNLRVQKTLLAAHAVPPEYQDNSDAYIDFVCSSVLPAAVRSKLVDAVDAYCESIAFSTAQIERLFLAAKALNIPIKLHADQLSNSGGAQLAAQHGALSADHIEYTDSDAVAAMADAGTVAVLLPNAFLTLGETQLPPLTALREHAVDIAVASDCNPGTAPICSLRTAMMLAARAFQLTPEECLAGVTRNSARALGLSDRGVLDVGNLADIAVWDISHPRELAYWLGTPQLAELFIGGHTSVPFA